ncbi:BDF_1d_G0043830.mRNA.1.CDS.1 [Saccharomyces cerevisiae]|nr:BDF_1d_G0043830.mRNA.1.CDS.1 [Saccharomyces cerevisiae]CAI7293790.1 BDF_1d_G0043830.mRNA.1.CDS.1 [Saccharomyces cerevisiae]
MYHAGSKVPTTFEWLAMDHEFSYSFGLRSPSYGENLWKRHGRFGNAFSDHPRSHHHHHHHQTKRSGFTKNALLIEQHRTSANFSILMGLLLRKLTQERWTHPANVVKCY